MPEPERHVAIVVVHGVGYHSPGESASEVAHLLLRVAPTDTDPAKRSDTAPYPSFTEEPLAYALSPLASVPDQCGGDTAATPVDRAFMRELLEDYQPDPADRVCESVRLHADRREKDGSTTGVDVYEVYWADICGPGPGALSVFSTFYNVLIHLPLVGQQVLRFASEVDGPSLPRWGWRAWSWLYQAAFFTFGIVIPVLTLLMVPLGLGILPVTMRDDLRQVVAAVLPVVATVGITFWLQYRRQSRMTMTSAVISSLAGLAVAMLVTWQWRLLLSPEVMLAEWWILSAALVVPVLVSLHRERRWVIPLGIVTYVVMSAALLAFGVRHHREAVEYQARHDSSVAAGAELPTIFNRMMRLEAPTGEDVMDDLHGRLDDPLRHELGRRTALFSLLNTFEWGYVVITIAWVVYAALVVLVVAAAWILVRLARRQGAADDVLARLRQMTFTTRLALIVPSVAFVFASFFAWSAYYNLAAYRVLPGGYAYPPQFAYPAIEFHRENPRDTAPCPRRIPIDSLLAPSPERCSARAFPNALEGPGATQLGIVSAGLVLVAIALVVWAAFPSGLTEYASPQAVPPDGMPPPAGDPRWRTATALGTWLTTGFQLARNFLTLHVLAVITGGAATAVMLPFDLPVLVAIRDVLRSAPSWLEPITLTRLLVTSGSAIGLVAVAQRFSAIGRGLRPFLYTAVDIADYLREFPRNRTPRARIMERYASLLRFLCRWRPHGNSAGPGYDQVIVVAHSQGTIISADFFRYLDHVRSCGAEPVLAKLGDSSGGLPVSLFTMGSPLRQLYARRFPHLYDWAADPHPDHLYGVREWVNVFRSGDYVGRSLWFREEPQVFVPGEVLVDDDARREYSLGAGAHTHYWDGTAGAVGLELDRLVRSGT